MTTESPSPRLDAEFLGRYLAGELSPAEVDLIRAWIARDPRHVTVVETLSDGTSAQIDTADALRRFQAARAAADRDGENMHREMWDHSGLSNGRGRTAWSGARRWSRTVAGLAAAAVVVVAAGVFVQRRGGLSHTARAPLTYATGASQFAVVVLADSSRVTLAPHSTLTVPADFGKSERAVALSGQARFDVIPDRHMPLSVRTGAVTTRVLGTAFDLRHYAHDPVGRVAVFSGKVATGAGTASMTLTAGMAGQFTDSTVTTVATGDSTVYVDWDRGQLVFRDAPLSLMFATLHEWYGYDFQLADSTLVHHHVSAIFVAGDVRQMLSTVTQILDVTITRRDSVLMLRPNQNVASPHHPGRSRRDTFQPIPTEVGR